MERNQSGRIEVESFSADREGMVPGDGGDEGEVQWHDGELGRTRRVVGQKCGDGVYPSEPLHEGIHRRGRAVHHRGTAGVLSENAGIYGVTLRP